MAYFSFSLILLAGLAFSSSPDEKPEGIFLNLQILDNPTVNLRKGEIDLASYSRLLSFA